MPELIANSFSSYSFTEEESKIACVLPDLTHKHIQHELSIANEKILAIEFDPSSADPVRDYIGQVQYYKGYAAALGSLIVTSEEAKTELQTQLEENVRSQNQN